jgi:hypothetical protein
MIESAEFGGSKRDLALIPLDRRVPLSRVSPGGLPYNADGSSAGGCPDSFTGNYFGYSFSQDMLLGWNNPATGDAGIRQRGTHAVSLDTSMGVYAGQFSLGAEIFDFIPGLGELLAAATGSGNLQILEAGDSGGPLFNASTVCGINSRAYPLIPSCHPAICVAGVCLPFPVICGLYIENHHTTVDSSDKREWILNEIVDPTGVRFRGICDEGDPLLRDIDSDRDLIPDGCDRVGAHA